MDFIGWYITGDSANSMDIKIHKQICEINESPIMLKLNPFDKNIDVRIIILKQYNNKETLDYKYLCFIHKLLEKVFKKLVKCFK